MRTQPNSPANLATIGRSQVRSLHLIDIENLVGGPGAEPATQGLDRYWQQVPYGKQDTVVIAGCGTTMRELAFQVHDLPCSLKVRNGPDGADLALLEAAPAALVVERYDRLVVGSGDHIFAPLLTAASASGVQTVVVSRSSSLAGCLRHAADLVVRIDEPAMRRIPMPPTHNLTHRDAA